MKKFIGQKNIQKPSITHKKTHSHTKRFTLNNLYTLLSAIRHIDKCLLSGLLPTQKHKKKNLCVLTSYLMFILFYLFGAIDSGDNTLTYFLFHFHSIRFDSVLFIFSYNFFSCSNGKSNGVCVHVYVKCTCPLFSAFHLRPFGHFNA